MTAVELGLLIGVDLGFTIVLVLCLYAYCSLILRRIHDARNSEETHASHVLSALSEVISLLRDKEPELAIESLERYFKRKHNKEGRMLCETTRRLLNEPRKRKEQRSE